MIRQVQSLNPEILAAWRALDVGIMHGIAHHSAPAGNDRNRRIGEEPV
jgi:hypothetical protein